MPDGILVSAAGCPRLPCPGHVVEAIDVNPLHWLGDAASAAVGDVWEAAMIGLWSAALWLLKLAFTIIDLFTTPDVSGSGPMATVLPTTLWLGATLAATVMFTQLIVAVVRRDGQSLGRLVWGIAQFGLAWLGYLAVAAVLVAAAAGLEKGILKQMLGVTSMSAVPIASAWPTKIGDATLATVLGVLALLLLIPAAFFYLLIMLVREAALIILIATAPISAAGLVNDSTKIFFWKTLRWFFACLLISPMAALMLGIGMKLSQGVLADTSAPLARQAGTAVIGCVVIAIGACCPLVLFRLLAFVDPGTASGAALRQSWSDSGGMTGLLGSRGMPPGSGSAALQSGSDGRSGGEAGAESQTQNRLMSALGPVGQGIASGTSKLAGLTQRAVDIGSDVLGYAGVGSPGYSMTPADERISRSNTNSMGRNSGGSGSGDGGTPPPSDGDAGGPQPPPVPPPPSPTPPTPGGSPAAAGAGGASAGAGAGAGGAEAATAAVAL